MRRLMNVFQCWDLRAKRMQPVQTLEETGDTVTSVDVTSYEIVVGCADAKVRRYDLRNGFLVTDLVGQHPVTSVAVSADSASLLVNLCQGDPLRLFDKAGFIFLCHFVYLQFVNLLFETIHTLTSATDDHKCSPFSSQILPVPEFLVSFMAVIFSENVPFDLEWTF